MRTKILHGPYGNAWAFLLEFDGGRTAWRRADDEGHALLLAQQRLHAHATYAGTDAVIERCEPPVRCPKLRENLEHAAASDGCYEAEGVQVPFHGVAPALLLRADAYATDFTIEGAGQLDSHSVTYRAYDSGWSFEVVLGESDKWVYAEQPYAWPDACLLHPDESLSNIAQAVAAFRQRFGGHEKAGG